MPEGDTIFRAARRLHAALAGRSVTEFRSVLPQLLAADEDSPIVGRSIEAVRSAGKNMLMFFSNDRILRTHMRMNGSWHIYRRGERWRARASDMRIVVGTDEYVAVGFSIPVAELMSARQLSRHPDLRRIGPDVLSDAFDREEAVRRISARGDLEIAEALLRQRLLAGIGNVFKSEVCFASGVNPFRRVRDLSVQELTKIVATAGTQMRMNTDPSNSSRGTTGRLNPREKLWVYGRGGQPCFRCGTPIRWQRQGRDARSTYWCPSCQV